MTSFLKNSIDIRKGERQRTWIMFGYIFLLIASYYILKTMTRSLFMKRLGADQLPVVYMMVAITVGIVAMIYVRLSANIRLDRLIRYTSLVLASNLVVFWWLFHLDWTSPVLFYGFYIWVSIYGILTTTQFWLLANYVFDAREAKRLFAILTAGAILGGIFGGYLTSATVKHIGGTANLSSLCLGFLLVTIYLMQSVWRLQVQSDKSVLKRPSPQGKQQSKLINREVFALIRNSRHLAFLVGIIAMTVLVPQIVDFQFNTYANDAIAGTDNLTEFLGFWLSNISVISLIFQLLFAGAIVRNFGVGAALLFLPLGLLGGSLWVLFGYGLGSILAVKITDGAFRYSINQVGTELLFLPIPSDVKNKTKAFVDMFADRLARGLGGLLLLIFYTWLGFSVAQISIIVLALIAIWLVLALSVRSEYVNSFRQALQKRRIDTEFITTSIKDEATIDTLIAALASRNERQVVYSLKLLDSVAGVDLISPLRPLLKHRSPEVRVLTLQLLRKHADDQLLPEVEPLLQDSDDEVRREAVRYFILHGDKPAAELVAGWLSKGDRNLRGAALHCAAENEELATELLTPEFIESFLRAGGDAQQQVADALGMINDPSYYPLLMELMEDSNPEVRVKAINSAGRTRSAAFVSSLIHHLGWRSDRKAAREALAAYGDSAIDILAQQMKDERVAGAIRLNIPRVLGLIGSQRSVEVLLESLLDSDNGLRYQIVKALNKLRARFSELHFDQRVEEGLLQEIRDYYQILATVYFSSHHERDENNASSDLLRRALRERLDDHLELIFRLLGLRYSPRDIYNAFAATISSNRSLRANAIEFLDNILSTRHKKLLIPLVEELPIEQVLQSADGLLEVRFENRVEALKNLVLGSDPWLRACALYEIGSSGLLPQLVPVVEQAKQAQHDLVQETASVVLDRYATRQPLING